MQLLLAYDTPAEPVESNMRWSRQSSPPMSGSLCFVIQIFAHVQQGYLEALFVFVLVELSHSNCCVCFVLFVITLFVVQKNIYIITI